MSEPLNKGLFTSGAFTKTWTTGEADTIYTEPFQVITPQKEVGLWSLFMVGTGSVNLSLQLQSILTPGTYSPVLHTIQGYTNGNSSLVSSFVPASGFESYININNSWWLYNPDGYRLAITRDANTEVVFTFAGVKAL